MRIPCLISLTCAASAAVGEDMPFAGRWAGAGASCEEALLIGSADLREDGRSCAVLGLVTIGETGAWAIRIECGGAVEDRVMLYDGEGDRLWTWQDADQRAPKLLMRCAP